MSQITSPATYSISRPQDVIDIVNKNSAINTSIGVIFIALGGILIDAYRAAMVGFGNKYIAAQFGISPGLAATVNASVLIAALIGGLLANRVINRFGQKRAFIIGMGLCTIGAAAVAIAPSIWWVLVCRVIMGFGLGIDFLWQPMPWQSFVVQRRRKPERRSTSGKWPGMFRQLLFIWCSCRCFCRVSLKNNCGVTEYSSELFLQSSS